MSLAFTNPYWDEILRLIREAKLSLDSDTSLLWPTPGHQAELSALISRFSPAIPAPNVLRAVVEFVGGATFEIDANTAYWTYLLKQRYSGCIAYNAGLASRFARGFVPFEYMDRQRRNVKVHAKMPLLAVASGTSTSNTALALDTYDGERFVYIGKRPRGPLETALVKGEWVLMGESQGAHTAHYPFVAHLFGRGAATVPPPHRGVATAWMGATRALPIVVYGTKKS